MQEPVSFTFTQPPHFPAPLRLPRIPSPFALYPFRVHLSLSVDRKLTQILFPFLHFCACYSCPQQPSHRRPPRLVLRRDSKRPAQDRRGPCPRSRGDGQVRQDGHERVHRVRPCVNKTSTDTKHSMSPRRLRGEHGVIEGASRVHTATPTPSPPDSTPFRTFPFSSHINSLPASRA